MSILSIHFLSLRSFFLLFSCLALLACHGKIKPPTNLPHTEAEARNIPATVHLTATDGLSLPIRIYKAEKYPQAVILALHGFGDSRDAWETMAPYLTKAGIEIIAPDIRGFGETQNIPKAHKSKAIQLLSDIETEHQWVVAHYPHKPVFIMGESMGGALAYIADNELSNHPEDHRALPYQGAILIAPAIMDIGIIPRKILYLWRGIMPHQVLTSRDMPGKHVGTNNYDAQRRMLFDPLTAEETNVGDIDTLVTVMKRAKETRLTTNRPLLLMWGDRDQFVGAGDIKSLIHHMYRENKNSAKIRLDEFPNGYHLLSRDKGDRVSNDVISWIFKPLSPLPSGGDTNAQNWLLKY